MLDQYSFKSRNFFSTFFSIAFLILLLLYTGYIEFFLDSQIQLSATNLLKNPITKSIVRDTASIRFRNRIGEFSLQKKKDGWMMQQPRVIPAKVKTIKSILKALLDIRIQTVHDYEPINFQSYNLDEPVIEIDLFTKDNTKYNIKVGIMNSTDNTSIISVSGHNSIFQTTLIEGDLEQLELSDFIDSQVFTPKLTAIKNFKLYHGKNTSPYNYLTSNNGSWQAKKYNVISNSNLEKKLQRILDIKTHMIIDKKDEQLTNFIDNYLDNPLYRIVIELENGEKIEYKVSSLIKAVPELKLEKRQFFIVHASNRSHPYIINKNYLEELQIRYSDLKP